jgi:predicted regulator of Ras-like GTPase activity (Roadblock/LC7/MglB family)
MTFREILAQVIDQTPGALAGAIMGSDGIAVEEYSAEGSDIDLGAVVVEFGGVFGQLRKVAGSLYGEGTDGLEELVLCTRKHQLLFRAIDDEYLFVVALDPLGMLGKARFLVRSVMEPLRSEL